MLYLSQFERKLKENIKKCNEYSHDCGKRYKNAI
jgi:ribosomal protein S17E